MEELHMVFSQNICNFHINSEIQDRTQSFLFPK